MFASAEMSKNNCKS